MKRALCIISGGMDSAICAYIAKQSGYEIVALHFDYGQRTMEKERSCFNNICDHLGVAHKYCLDVHFIKTIGHNALTDINMNINASSAESSTPNTYVPFRNGIFLSIAGGIAEVQACQAIFIGVIQEDNSGYPDCSEIFLQKAQSFINQGRSTDISLSIHAPLLHMDKAQIVTLGMQIGVPLELTWSCYQGSDIACGICDSCIMRLRGFKQAGYTDKIAYANLC